MSVGDAARVEWRAWEPTVGPVGQCGKAHRPIWHNDKCSLISANL